jgi:pyruvate-formate lyase-activating enzyme
MLDKFVKYKLDQIGPGFCLAKWTNSTMHLGMGKNHSCHHPHPHKIPINEIVVDSSALHNSNYKKQIRTEMLNGGRPQECNYCWKIEDAGNDISDRVILSSKFDSIFNYNKIKNTTIFDPTYLEVSFSNSCNFACAYCGPEYSSKWANEIKIHGPYTDSDFYNGNINEQYPDKEYNPYIDAFWKYLPQMYSKLKTLRITGGEPLMSRYTNQLLSYINDNPNKNLTLVVNTNLGVTPAKLNSFIRKLKLIQHKVKRIDIATSGESYGSRAEYVRDGLNYNRWYNNCVTILTEITKVRLHIMCAYNLFAITSFTQFLTDVKKLKDSYKKVLVSVTYVRDPAFMSIALAPKDWLHYLEESKLYLKTNFSRESVKRFDHAVAFFNASVADDKNLMHLKNFILEYDKRRNKNFLNVFPEYKFIFA